MKRCVNWDSVLANELNDPEFAKDFILSCIEDEGLSIQQALSQIIRTIGIKEFSEKTNIPSSNLIRLLRDSYNPTISTLNKVLKPFGLSLSVTISKKAA